MEIFFLHLIRLHGLPLVLSISCSCIYFTQHCFWLRNSLHGKRSAAVGSRAWNSLVLLWSPSWSSWFKRMVKWTFEDSVTASSRWQFLARLGQSSPEDCVCFESASNIWCIFPIARIQGSRNQGVEMGVAPFTITPSNPPSKFLPPVPVTLCSAGLEILVPGEGMLPPGDTAVIHWTVS